MKSPESKKFTSLFIKITAVCFLCMIAPMLVNFFYTINSASRALESEASSSLSRLAQEKNKQVDVVFHLQSQISNAMTNEIFMVDFFKELSMSNVPNSLNLNKISQNLETRLRNVNGLYENIFFTYKDKILVDGIGGKSVGYAMDPKLEAYYYKQLQNPGVAISEYMYSPISGRPVIAVSNSLIDPSSKKVLSALVLAVDLSKLTEELAKNTTEQNANTLILDSSGLVIASNKQEQTLKLNFSKGDRGTQDFYTQMKAQPSGIGYFTIDGVKNIASYVKAGKYGLYMVTFLPVEQYMGKVAALKTGLILVIAISAALSALFVLFYVSKIVRPIRLVSKVAQQIADGDLTVDKINLKNNDEIGELATSVNHMVHNLRELIASVMISSQNVADASDQISASTLQVASGSSAQAEAAQNMQERFIELSAAINSVAEGAEEAAKMSSKTSSIAHDGGTIVKKSVESMSQVSTQMTRLEEDSTKIGDIIEVIDDIAKQTNLLALNAAIEAARAGEQGRGFAVVADEVRRLAERSGEATKQITTIIKGMQENTNRSVSAVTVGVTQSQETGEAFKRIIEMINQTEQKVTEIAAASEEQAAQAGEVMHSIENISSASQEAAAASEETAATSQSLAQLADKLNYSTAAFKIK
jgi:methyl-accepting chemotaxis protein